MAANSISTSDLKLIIKQNPAAEDQIAELRRKRSQIKQGGGQQRIDKHHAAGKLTARERVEELADRGSFQEIGLFAKHRATYFGMADKDLPADGVITGCATVDGRLIHLASQDFTVAGGAAGEVHCDKITKLRLSPSSFWEWRRSSVISVT